MADVCFARPTHHATRRNCSTSPSKTLVPPSIRLGMVSTLFYISIGADGLRRDYSQFNPTLTFALFPSISMLYPDDFIDLANITRSAQPKAYLLDRALLADRSAAFRGQWTAPTSRTVANALHLGETSRWWWEPIRRQVLRYSGVSEDVINRNLEGTGAMDPAIVNQPNIVGPGIKDFQPAAPPGTYSPVITYISRQKSRRRLTAESHLDLVTTLEERAAKHGWELVIVEAENMAKEDQLALAGRTTVSVNSLHSFPP